MDGLFYERTLCAEYCASADALFFFILVDFPLRGTGKSKGNSALCGARPAYAAGLRQGTRPLDPDCRLRAGFILYDCETDQSANP